MNRRGALTARLAVLAFLPLSCGQDGTVNNGDVVLATTVRMSISEAGDEPIDHAYQASISDDGSRVVFVTSTRMHPDDTDANIDVFMKDVFSGTITLVDRSTGISGAKAAGGAASPRISGDGRRVVFTTYAQLDPADVDGAGDVYVRDLETHETILASRATGLAGVKANRECFDPDISADGRHVVFTTIATNLAAGDADGLQDIYVRDLESGVTELISRPTGAAGKSNASCASPRVSAGGLRVVFLSAATNLEPSTDGTQHVYVRDRGAAVTTLVSRASGAGGAHAATYSQWPDISDDGRVVCYMSSAVNLDPNDLDNFSDVYVRDVDAAVTEHVSRASGSDGKDAVDECLFPSISGDGRFVTFMTLSSNLVKNDENLAKDIFVRDRVARSTFRVSLRTFGGEGNGDAMEAAISADGRFVVFGSRANNLVEGDGNGMQDVFWRGPLR